MIEITKACIVAFMKSRNSLIVWCREKQKKQKMVKMYFLKPFLKIFCQYQNVVHSRPSSKWASWKGNEWYATLLCYITKNWLDVQFVNKIFLEMGIGQQMKEEGYDQNR